MIRTVPLEEAISLDFGFAFRSADFNTVGEGLPLIKIGSVVTGTSDTYYDGVFDPRYLVSDGDYLVGMSGGFNFGRWRGGRALLNQRVARLGEPSPGVDRDYVARFLSTKLKAIEDETPFATVRNMSAKTLRSVQVPLPPLDEQRRIAAILDQADSLRGKRGEVLTHLADLRASIFSDMFGDPVASSGGTTLAKVADIQIGPFGSLLHKEDYVTGGVPLINPSHIINGEIRPAPDFSVTAEKAATLKNYQLRAGDVVMGRRGEMGRCAVVEVEHDGYLCGTGSLIVRPRPDLAESTYLQAALSNASAKSLLERLALGSTLPNLNAAIVSGLPIRTPALTEQKKFRATLERLGMNDQLVQRAIDAGDGLFRSLQYRAFIGQL